MFVTSWGSTPENSEAALLESQEIFKGTFGDSANLNPQSINGLFIQEIANIILNNDSGLQLLYNGILNPNVAPGIFLDAICAWLQLVRSPSTKSVVTCTCTGLSGVTIPANSQVMNTNGDLFTNLDAAVIGVGGTVDVIFTAVVAGEIPCDPDTVNRIVQTVSGWDSVNNDAAGVVGTNQETDYSLRQRRVATLAKNSTGLLNSLASALSDASDIQGYWILLNNTDAPVDYDTGLAPYVETITVAPHTVYVSIYGGTNDEIGEIFYTVLNGVGTQGDMPITYTDPDYDWIEADFTYQLPIAERLEVDVLLPGAIADYPANTVTLIQTAIYNNFYGLDGAEPVIMPKPIFASRFQAAIATQVGIQNISALTIGKFGNAIFTEFQLPITEFGTLAAVDVFVTFTE